MIYTASIGECCVGPMIAKVMKKIYGSLKVHILLSFQDDL